jgi:hypothetical protein
VRVDAAGEDGQLVVSVAGLVLRPVRLADLEGARRGGRDSLFRVEWVPAAGEAPAGGEGPTGAVAVLGELAGAPGEWARFADLAALEAALAGGMTVPGTVMTAVEPAVGGMAAGQAAGGVLGLLQGWLASADLAGTRLVLVTRNAVAAGGVVPDPVQAAVWGLVSSAQSEHPGRFVLADIDGGEVPDWGAVAGAGEPRVAVRSGRLLAPRLARADSAGTDAGLPLPGPAGTVLEPTGTVLVTGGTGGLGALVARHLAARHGARHLLLVSRRGTAAPGAAQLAADLAGLGADVRVAACDAADRDQLTALLRSLEWPLTAVVHAAGVIEDGLIESLEPGQLERVLRPKADAALHLHELTRDADLDMFVLFSSAAGLIGSPGQGGYAAANAFLDALAGVRRAAGLPGVSLAWGLWADDTGMTGGLGEAGRGRLARMGIGAIEAGQGLELFDRALGLGEPALVPVLLDQRALRAQARAGSLPALLAGLVPAQARPAGPSGSLEGQLGGVARADWERVTLALVRAQVAAVLGHASAEAVEPGRPFKEMGFDSLAAVEFRNQLAQATGLRLASTLVFDHPTPAAVAAHLLTHIIIKTESPIDRQFAELEAQLTALDAAEKERMAGRLRVLLNAITDSRTQRTSDRMKAATTLDDVFELLDSEFGESVEGESA